MSESHTTDLSFRHVLRTSPMDFWRLWYVGMVVSTVRWLETVAMGIVVYAETGSALVVAMRALPRTRCDDCTAWVQPDYRYCPACGARLRTATPLIAGGRG